MAWSGTPVAASSAIPLMNAAGTTGVNSAAAYRQGFIGSLISPALGGPMAWRQGIFPTTYSIVSATHLDLFVQSGTGRNVTVGAGNCVIVRSGINGGPYLVGSNQATTLTLDPSDTTNLRTDTVCVQLADQAIGDTVGSTQGGYLTVVNGTAGAGAPAPAVPTGYLPLMDVRRAANSDNTSTATFTDRRFSAGVYGGIRPLLGGDTPSAAGAYIGETTYTTAGGLRWWDGGQWRGTTPVTYRVQTNAAVTATAASSGVLQTVTITDPGWPYYIQASGSYFWDTGGASGIFVSGVINLDQATLGTTLFDGGAFAWGTAPSSTASSSSVAGQNQWFGTNTGIVQSVTGSHTVRFFWRNDSAIAYNIHLGTGRLNVVVVPL